MVATVALYAFTVIAYFVLPVGAGFNKVLIGSAVYNHDAVLNAGILEWGFRSLWTPGLHLFDWPAGFPLKNGLAGTENLIGWQVFFSPMRALGASVAAAYNITVLASLVVSGAACALLARRLGASVAGAMIGGFVFAFNPFHLDHLIHVQTMAICWSPLAILGLDMSLEKTSLRGLSVMAVGILMTVTCGMYFAVFLAMVLPMYAILCWVTGRHRFAPRPVVWVGAVGILCAVAVLPLLLPYVDFARAYGRYPHPEGELALSALSLESLVQTPGWLSTWEKSVLAARGTGWFANAFPGVVTIVLAGVSASRSVRGTRRNVVVLLVLAIVCLLLAFGPTLQLRPGHAIAGSLPFPGKLWLYFSAIRWPMRIFMYTVLCLAVLAALGAGERLSSFRHDWRIPISALIMTLLFFELRPAMWFAQDSLTVSDPIEMSDAYAFLKLESDRGGVVELPSRKDSGFATPYATLYAYGSASHLRGVVAFHGSMFPPVLESLRVASGALPAPEAVRLMKGHGVSRVVIHRDLMSDDSARIIAESLNAQGYQIVFNTRRSIVFSLIR